MRIEAYTQVQKLYDTKKTAKTQLKDKVGASDQLQISSFGKEIQIAKQAVAESSDRCDCACESQNSGRHI